MRVKGDYKNPPPAGTYEGLHGHSRRLLKASPVKLPSHLWSTVGEACLTCLKRHAVRPYAISVGPAHVHAALSCTARNMKQVAGHMKRTSSHAIREAIPGRVWQAGCHVAVVRNRRHWQKVLDYIGNHAPGAWVWRRDNGP